MKHFISSDHLSTRMSQRGFRKSDIAFVLERGTALDEGIILTNDDVRRIEHEARVAIALAHRLKGTFLPCSDGIIKTIFKASKEQQSRLL